MTAEDLLAICKAVVADPALQPQGTTTHCNQAVSRILFESCGVKTFDGLTADTICSVLSHSYPAWTTCTGQEAQDQANSGGLAMAAAASTLLSQWSGEDEYHGHVAIVCPGQMVQSEHWGKPAPTIANVGIKNAIMGANWAFRKEPLFYLYNGES